MALIHTIHQRFPQPGYGREWRRQIVCDAHDQFAPPKFLLTQLFYIAIELCCYFVKRCSEFAQLSLGVRCDMRLVISRRHCARSSVESGEWARYRACENCCGTH